MIICYITVYFFRFLLGFYTSRLILTNTLVANGRLLAIKVCFTQSLAVLFVSISIFVMFGGFSALSALMGGLICILPSGVFALLAFRYSGASQNEQVVRSFSQGSKLKLALTVILGVMAFKWLQLDPLPLFGTFIVATVAQWIALANIKEF